MQLIKLGTILNSSCQHSYKQGSVTFTVAIKLFWLYFSGKAFWRSEGNLHSTVDPREQIECWRALRSSPADKNKCNVCIHHEQVYSCLMFYLLLVSWNCDLCDIPSDPPLWPVQLMVKSWLFNKTACFCLCGWALCTWQMGRSTNVMKSSVQMTHRSILDSMRLFMFNLKPLWYSMSKWGLLKVIWGASVFFILLLFHLLCLLFLSFRLSSLFFCLGFYVFNLPVFQ